MRSDSNHAADLSLARAAAAGSNQALRKLVGRLQCVPRIVVSLNRRSSRPLAGQDVEDATQDALAAIWRQIPTYSGRSSLETWAFGVCQNVLSEHRRSLGRRSRQVPIAEEPSGAEPDPCEEAWLVRRALESIEPPEDQEFVRLRHFEGLSFEDLGTRFEMQLATVKSRYYRALTRLKDILEPLRREGIL